MQRFSPAIISNCFTYTKSEGEGHPLELSRSTGNILPFVTPSNKKEIIYEESGFGERLRKNVIVVGDIVEDAGMVCETKHDCILKVGILVTDPKDEVKYNQTLEGFNKTFDLIVKDDGSFTPLIDTLRKISGGE